MDALRDFGALVGRILLAAIFVYSGLGKVMNMGAFASATSSHFVHAGLPASLVYPGLYLSVAVELGGGLLIMAGLQARWAALIIFLWLIPVTLIFHVADYQQAVQQAHAMAASVQQVMYLKNISMMGGLLVLAAMGPGHLSIDGRRTATPTSSARRAA
jgi:putative oxidoreductase